MFNLIEHTDQNLIPFTGKWVTYSRTKKYLLGKDPTNNVTRISLLMKNSSQQDSQEDDVASSVARWFFTYNETNNMADDIEYHNNIARWAPRALAYKQTVGTVQQEQEYSSTGVPLILSNDYRLDNIEDIKRDFKMYLKAIAYLINYKKITRSGMLNRSAPGRVIHYLILECVVKVLKDSNKPIHSFEALQYLDSSTLIAMTDSSKDELFKEKGKSKLLTEKIPEQLSSYLLLNGIDLTSYEFCYNLLRLMCTEELTKPFIIYNKDRTDVRMCISTLELEDHLERISKDIDEGGEAIMSSDMFTNISKYNTFSEWLNQNRTNTMFKKFFNQAVEDRSNIFRNNVPEVYISNIPYSGIDMSNEYNNITMMLLNSEIGFSDPRLLAQVLSNKQRWRNSSIEHNIFYTEMSKKIEEVTQTITSLGDDTTVAELFNNIGLNKDELFEKYEILGILEGVKTATAFYLESVIDKCITDYVTNIYRLSNSEYLRDVSEENSNRERDIGINTSNAKYYISPYQTDPEFYFSNTIIYQDLPLQQDSIKSLKKLLLNKIIYNNCLYYNNRILTFKILLNRAIKNVGYIGNNIVFDTEGVYMLAYEKDKLVIKNEILVGAK